MILRPLCVLFAALALLALPASAMALAADGAPGASASRGAGSASAARGAGAGSAAGELRAAAAKAGVTITTRRIGRYGEVVTDGRGLPVYVFTADRGSSSRCYGACARAWPVTYARGAPRAAGRVRQARLGTTRRRGGAVQVTLRGRPLYFYVSDRPGVALCHDVREFGGLWLLVRADGTTVPRD